MGVVFQQPNPFPTMTVYRNDASGDTLAGIRESNNDRDGIVGNSLKRANLREGQAPIGPARRRPVRRPAAAAVHRQGNGPLLLSVSGQHLRLTLPPEEIIFIEA